MFLQCSDYSGNSETFSEPTGKGFHLSALFLAASNRIDRSRGD